MYLFTTGNTERICAIIYAICGQESLCLQKRSHRHLNRVVRSCVLRWKQRALYKPNTVQELEEDPQKKKKSVTFGRMTPEWIIIPPPDSLEQEDEFKEIL